MQLCKYVHMHRHMCVRMNICTYVPTTTTTTALWMYVWYTPTLPTPPPPVATHESPPHIPTCMAVCFAADAKASVPTGGFQSQGLT